MHLDQRYANDGVFETRYVILFSFFCVSFFLCASDHSKSNASGSKLAQGKQMSHSIKSIVLARPSLLFPKISSKTNTGKTGAPPRISKQLRRQAIFLINRRMDGNIKLQPNKRKWRSHRPGIRKSKDCGAIRQRLLCNF